MERKEEAGGLRVGVPLGGGSLSRRTFLPERGIEQLGRGRSTSRGMVCGQCKQSGANLGRYNHYRYCFLREEGKKS